MKWIFLIMLISCGKHITPSPIDYKDSDGDNVLNYAEEGLHRHIANVTHLKNIPGILSFFPNGPKRKPIEIEFSNRQDYQELAFEMLTKNHKAIKSEDYFSEWSRIRFKPLKTMPHLSGPISLTLNFMASEKGPTSLWLVNGNNKRKLSHWTSPITTTLTSAEMEAVLEGSAHLALFNDWLEKLTIVGETQAKIVEKKTYRVFFLNKEESKIYYVSKDLPYEEFLKVLQIEHFHTLIDQDLFLLYGYLNEKQWWSRDVEDKKDKVLVNATPDEVTQAYIRNLTLFKKSLFRRNGKSEIPLSFEKAKDAKFYVKIRGHKIERTIIDNTFKRDYGVPTPTGTRVKWECTYFSRQIKTEEHKDFIESDLNFIKITTDNGSILPEEAFFIEQGIDAKGAYWILGFLISTEKIEINLHDQPASAYTATGIYDYHCSEPFAPRELINPFSTNSEAKMEVSLETFVEKL